MNILVLGDGLLATEIIKQTNWNYVSRKKDNINFSNVNSYLQYLNEIDVIVNCIAHTDTYSTDQSLHWNINVAGLNQLIHTCNNLGIKLVHISTDYLYAGSISNAKETDVPVHINTWYGYSKLIGDALVQLNSENFLLCRLSHKPTPFPYKSAWCDIKTNCDYVDVISSILIDLIKKSATGLYNVGTDCKNMYELAIQTNKNVSVLLKPDHVPSDTTMNINKLNNFLNKK